MNNERKIIQLVMETRNITATISDEGGEINLKIPVFGWKVYEDGYIEPLFINKDFQIDHEPYNIDIINKISKKDVAVIHYDWD
jgi:hypothetical protein